MTYRKFILGSGVVTGMMLFAVPGAMALDVAIDTGSRGSGPMELATVLTLITLAPALLIMLTSFTRIVIVLSLLRQALGLQQTPPNIVITGLALFLTMLVMAPTWSRIQSSASNLTWQVSWHLKTRSLMHKGRSVISCYGRRESRISRWRAVCWQRAISRFRAVRRRTCLSMLWFRRSLSSELTSAFRVGFLIFLPFLVIDLVGRRGVDGTRNVHASAHSYHHST